MIDLTTYLEDDIKDCMERLSSMEDYMKLKMGEGDWHAVADAAMDIREIDARVEAHTILLNLVKFDKISGLKP